MPIFELSLVLKVLPRSELSAALKRVGTFLLEKEVVLQKIENHGMKDLPYRFNVATQVHTKGSYFIFRFMSSRKSFPEIYDICKRDVDILRHGITLEPKEFKDACTLEEEMKPPALRKSVQELIEAGKKKRDKSKPVYRHLREHNFFDIYM